MGNNPPKPSGSPIKSVVPTTKNTSSKLINDMMMRTFRRIEEDNYLLRQDGFTTKVIYYEEEKTIDSKDKYESTQPLFNNYEDSKESTLVMESLIQSKSGTTKDGKASKKIPDSKSTISTNGKGIVSKQDPKIKSNPSSAPQSKRSTTKEQIKTSNVMSKKPGSKLDSRASTKPEAKTGRVRNINADKNSEQDFEAPAVQEQMIEKLYKKRLVINCALDKKIFLLPDHVQFIILSFLLEDYPRLVLVSPLFYYKVNDLLDNFLVSLDNSFLKSHMSLLSFKRSYFSVIPYQFRGEKHLRMDRNIIAEVLDSLEGKTLTIGYSYELVNKKGLTYKAHYKFDVVQKGNRTIWIYKEELLPSFEDKTALVQPIIPVCVNDNIKFAINFYSMTGPINLNTIQWKQPIIEEIPFIPRTLRANQLEGLDKNRYCEVEAMHDEWFLYQYYDKKTKVETSFFDPFLTLKDAKCAGVDIVSLKSKYEATEEGRIHFTINFIGKVPRAYQKLGVNIEVFPEFEEIVAEVKRHGFFFDIDNFLQLRKGDKLIFYLSRPGDT